MEIRPEITHGFFDQGFPLVFGLPLFLIQRKIIFSIVVA
jgi:hypothetical protein